MATDVSVVVVSYNTLSFLRECLASVLRSEGVSVEVFVVDNGSVDGSAEMVETAFPSVRLMRNPRNVGFAAANNLAFAHASGRHVLLLNSDATVPPNTIAVLSRCLDDNGDIGVCGPLVLFPDGTFQSCGYTFPSPRSELLASKRIGRVARWFSRQQSASRPDGAQTDVDWVDGCCLMTRLDIVRQIGGLDEQYFMYGEELDFCKMVRRRGWRVAAVPTATAAHHRGKSSDGTDNRTVSWLTESRLRYYRKHLGLPAAALMSLWFVASYAKQLRMSPASSRAKLGGVITWWRSIFLRLPAGARAR